jgi:hypothetical protein
MSQFAIMRIEKAGKNYSQIGGIANHNHRLKPVKNANPELEKLNQYDPDKTPLVKKVRELIGDKSKRKDSVKLCEILLTFSPEWWAEIPDDQKQQTLNQWKNASMDWAKKTFGSTNVVDWALHQDESTPHMHICFVPLTKDGKLCAKEIVGGKKELSRYQDTYHKSVEAFGLKRGIRKSQARHTTIKQYYEDINQTEEKLEQHLDNISDTIKNLKPPTIFEAMTGLEDWFSRSVEKPMARVKQIFKSVYKQKKQADQLNSKLKTNQNWIGRKINLLENFITEIGLNPKEVTEFPERKMHWITTSIKAGLIKYNDEVAKLEQEKILKQEQEQRQLAKERMELALANPTPPAPQQDIYIEPIYTPRKPKLG